MSACAHQRKAKQFVDVYRTMLSLRP